MSKLLILGFAVINRCIVEAAMQSMPAVKHRSLLAGWIEPEREAACYSHRTIISPLEAWEQLTEKGHIASFQFSCIPTS